MTFQTCQIPKLRGQYFDMLLNMFYLESYLKRWRRSSKIVELPFRLDVFCCSFQNVCLMEGVLAGTLFMTFQTCQYRSFGPIFRYVAQYIIYRNISDGKRRTNKDCWITFERVVLLFVPERLPQRRRSFGRKTVHANSNIENTKLRGQYFDMLLNMFDIESYPTDSVARAKVVELPLTLWSSAVVPGLFDQLKTELWGVHAISNIENTQATRPIFRYVAQYGQHRSLKGC